MSNEPVAWMYDYGYIKMVAQRRLKPPLKYVTETPLYTRPPADPEPAPELVGAGLLAKLPDAIKQTEYKYFGDYELSKDQWDAVDTLVELARHILAKHGASNVE